VSQDGRIGREPIFPRRAATRAPTQDDIGGDGEARLARQLEALKVELEEQTRQYEETMEHVARLEADASKMRSSAEAIEHANVRAALLMEELEDREQKYREQADSLRRTSAELDKVHRQLETAHGELQSEQALKQKYLTRMERELETARNVQQVIIREPQRATMAGLDLAVSYMPAGETGGDWLGFLDNQDQDEVELLIGDVTGHGLGAALITAGAASAIATIDELRRAATEAAQPGGKGLRELLRRAGAESVGDCIDKLAEPSYLLELLDGVVGHMGGHRFLMTFFAASYARKTRTLRYANAGHVLPFLLGKEDMARAPTRFGSRQLQARGNPLGQARGDDDEPRDQHTAQLEVGDLLLFYTDGLVENSDAKRKPIGARNVVAWMRELYDRPVREIRDGLEERVRTAMGKVAPADDTTFIVARVGEDDDATNPY
jgi:serine phosphatase RsbU (regulator of sigma subunit)